MAESQAETVKATQAVHSKVLVVAAFMAFFHIACFAFIYTGVSFVAVMTAFAMYVIRGIGVTGGYHRLLAHRAFKTSRFVQFLFALAGSLAVQGGPIWWVSHHRSHHRDTDTDEDIHSPVTRGMWKAHMGWMMTDEAFNENGANSRDLHKFAELKFLQRYYVWLVLLEIIGLFGFGSIWAWVFPESGTSGLQMLVWGFFISTVFTWHVTFMVNSVCHRYGSQPYDTKDASTNNVFVGVLGFGEGWHNNHHYYPNSARHGLRWWQLDTTWWLIRLLQVLGIVSEPKLPKELREQS
jgi:stearoyl-CoA desaturase (delta-9 desaturase)